MQSVKVTKRLKSETKRGYEDACGTAHGLELIGERWAMLVLRELMLGPRRFSGLKADLPGISANVLAQRLGELEERGLVRRRKLPPPANVQVYEATEWGLEAEPIMQTLGRWATRSPAHNPGLPLSAVSLMLSFRTMLDAERAKGLAGSFGFRLGQHHYLGELADGRFEVERAEVGGADVIFTAAAPQIARVVYGGAPLDSITVEGDKALAKRFVTLFPLPSKAAGHE
jgi:DNA-binding HxlR family transcriptional regulator